MSDPVAVDAGLMAEADRAKLNAAIHQALWVYCGRHAVLRSEVDAAQEIIEPVVYAALQAAEERGAERMRERVAAAFPDEPARGLRLTCEEVRMVIRALPLSETEK